MITSKGSSKDIDPVPSIIYNYGFKRGENLHDVWATMKNRAVITGIGPVTPAGIGKEAFWSGMLSCRSFGAPVSLFDPAGMRTRIAAEIKNFDPASFIPDKMARRMDRYAQFGLIAAKLAVEDALLTIDDSNRESTAVIVGSGIGGMTSAEKWHTVLLEKGPERVTPFIVPMQMVNSAASYISLYYNTKGPMLTISTACSSSLHALGAAYGLIKSGESDIIIAGGADAPVSAMIFAGFCALRAMTGRNEEPEKASRPFDLKRDGFLPGEGAGFMIIERLDRALERDAKIYAEIVGYGRTSDSFHITAPEKGGKSAARTIRLALQDAQLEPESVDFIIAHGTSTQLNDKEETSAIKLALGEWGSKVPVTSIKSIVGHLMGATGAVETITASLALSKGVLTPIVNYREPDPECDLNIVSPEPITSDFKISLSTSFGFGGSNASLVLKKYEGE